MCILNLLVQSLSSNTQFSTKNAFLKGNCTSSEILDSQADSTNTLDPISDLDFAATYGNITSGIYTYGSHGYQINMVGIFN